VIQCLTPSAVTSLGSPAKPVSAWQQGALSAWTSEYKGWNATGQSPSRFFVLVPESFCGHCNPASGLSEQLCPREKRSDRICRLDDHHTVLSRRFERSLCIGVERLKLHPFDRIQTGDKPVGLTHRRNRNGLAVQFDLERRSQGGLGI
jgi:hypothetical protein